MSTPPTAGRPPFLRFPSDVLRAALLLAILVAAWAPDALLGLGVYWHHDLRHHHYPWRVWAAGEWAAGHVPLWCSGAANGYPLMADGQAGALYPPTMLLFLALPAPLAMNWSVLLHLWIAGLGTWLLARALGRSELAALLAAIAFAFSGFVATHTLYLGMQNAVAWLPVTLWALVRATETEGTAPPWRRPWWALVALGLALAMLAGHVQIAVWSWLLVGAVAAWRTVTLPASPRHRIASLALFAAAALVAVCLAAPQLLATWELTRFSMRDGGTSAAFAGIGSLPPQEILNGILPRLFGFDRPADITETYYHRGTGYWGMGENHWEMAFYLGIPVVFFSAWAWIRRGEWLWKAVAVAAVLLMLGRFTPAWGLLRHLPGLDGFRFPVRFALWLTLAMALLAARGFDGLQDAALAGRTRTLRSWCFAWAGIALVVLLGATAAHQALHAADAPLRGMLTARFEAQTALPPPPDDLGPLQRAALPSPEPEDPAAIPAKVDHILGSLAESTSPFSPQVLWPVFQVLALAGLSVILLRQRTRLSTAGLTAVLLLAMDLYGFGGRYHPRVPRDEVQARPLVVEALEGDPADYRVTVVDRRVHPSLDVDLASASLGLLWGLQDVIVTSPLLMVRNEVYLALAGLDIGSDKGQVKAERLLAHLPLANALGLRYLASPLSIEDPRLEPLIQGEVNVWRNHDALPLAWLVGCVHPAAGPEEVLTLLPHLDTAREAVVEAPDLPASLTGCASTLEGEATILSHDARAWRLRTRADREALLVVSESHYPGWEARIDGATAPIHATDLILRGVVVPPGEHEVTLTYAPGWLPLSGALAGVGGLGIVGLAGLGLGRGRRRLMPQA